MSDSDQGHSPGSSQAGVLPLQAHLTADPGYVKVQDWLRGFTTRVKVGRGHEAVWRLGHIQVQGLEAQQAGDPSAHPGSFWVEFGLRQQRQRGWWQLLFFRQVTKGDGSIKLLQYGYLLFTQTCNVSTMMGMLVYENFRGRGLAKLLLATWLRMCDIRAVEPRTHRIDKPLVSIVLQRFGFTPMDQQFGIAIAPEPQTNTNIRSDGQELATLIWSENYSKITSIFSKRALRDQNLKPVHLRPANAIEVFVCCSYSPATKEERDAIVNTILEGLISWQEKAEETPPGVGAG